MTEEKIPDKQKYLLVWLCRESVFLQIIFSFFCREENVYDDKWIVGKKEAMLDDVKKRQQRRSQGQEIDRKPFDLINNLKNNMQS